MLQKDFVLDVLNEELGNSKAAIKILQNSEMIQYIQIKTRSVYGDSKSRPSLANLYAIYVLVEDYINQGYENNPNYLTEYHGMKFTDALNRVRSLPFGEKLQNHALNNRCNHEFRKYHKKEAIIVRQDDSKYFINSDLLQLKINDQSIDISSLVLRIIDKYVELRSEKFNSFFDKCKYFSNNIENNQSEAIAFIEQQLDEKADARVFEIISYLICKYHYINRTMFIGVDNESVCEVPLTLYKTGRTNANDGGIDFIMLPLGRVFQVTEVIEFKKYFLDIDKINKFPITFVVKSNYSPIQISEIVKQQASGMYSEEIVNKYLSYFEEIISLPTLRTYFSEILKENSISEFFTELIQQCVVEFNVDYEEDDNAETMIIDLNSDEFTC